ncbi:MAG: class I SAM-dependent methyltransferase [Eubacteriales bacterium]|nr:class I SAM-dependent methyltransferase [Eubacteriales bacterium]
MHNIQINEWIHEFIKKQVQPGDLCIDATMGNGNDTLLLSQLCGNEGTVLAFDIQFDALLHTMKYLGENNAPANYRLLHESHEMLEKHADPQSASCIVFNLGYLPGGDHTIATKSESSIKAMESALSILKKGGLMCVSIYSGQNSGFSERDDVLNWLKNLNSKKYLVIKSDYYNRPNNPPIPVLVVKL